MHRNTFEANSKWTFQAFFHKIKMFIEFKREQYVKGNKQEPKAEKILWSTCMFFHSDAENVLCRYIKIYM